MQTLPYRAPLDVAQRIQVCLFALLDREGFWVYAASYFLNLLPAGDNGT
jgi:hypothetical protein